MTLDQNAYRRLAILIGVGFVIAWVSASVTSARVPMQNHQTVIARGDYITHHVAMCVECHSPRDERGVILASEEFKGAPVLISAPYWHPDWALREPAIGGLPGFTDEQVITLLVTGQATNRNPPKRPMPPFRMTREDAEAVVAYLRTR